MSLCTLAIDAGLIGPKFRKEGRVQRIGYFSRLINYSRGWRGRGNEEFSA